MVSIVVVREHSLHVYKWLASSLSKREILIENRSRVKVSREKRAKESLGGDVSLPCTATRLPLIHKGHNRPKHLRAHTCYIPP